MSWPDLNAGDMETRIRTCLNEATADFYTQANIWQWLSAGSTDIAQKSLCVQRVLTGYTTPLSRNVAVSAYKVQFVEYLPSSGRYSMLEKIDPLKVGHFKIDGATPQYWYENGGAVGIDPIPDAVYNLRFYVADLPYVDGAEANFDSTSDQTELVTEWQYLMILYAIFMGLVKNKKMPQAQVIHSIYSGELNYLRQNLTDIIPDGWNSVEKEESWPQR